MRESLYLRSRYGAILSHTGPIFVLIGGLMLVPLCSLIVWPEEAGGMWGLIVPALLLAGLGLTLWSLFRGRSAVVLSLQEGGVIVLLSWVVVCLFSAWPFMHTGLTFTQACFESVSGWTTTGLSVVDVTKASHLTLLWRSVMQLAGGAGLAIIMLSAITGPTGPGLSAAEGRGDQLVPHVRRSAKLVIAIYSGYVAVGIPAYLATGMNVFDAVNHTFAAVSTGGFGTRAESIGYWDSPAIEAVTIVLTIFGNLSFVTAWTLLKGNLGAVVRNGEVKLMALILPIAAASVCTLTCIHLYPSLGKSVRVAVFETVSALTTTGFSTVGYKDWNNYGVFVLILLMLIGGGTCSTAGGIKQYRVHLLWRSLVWEFRRQFQPRGTVTANAVWEGDREVYVNDARLRQVGTFLFLYFCTFAIGSLILIANGYGVRESLFEYASSLSTVGLSVGVTSPDAPTSVLWAETAGMLLGRLEIMVLLTSGVKLVRDTCVMFSPSGRA